MDSDLKQPFQRLFAASAQADGEDPYGQPLTLDEIAGCHAADADFGDAEGALDQEIYAGLVAP